MSRDMSGRGRQRRRRRLGEELGEELQRRRDRFLNLFEVAHPRSAGGSFGDQNLGEPADDRKLVLEVVPALVGIVDGLPIRVGARAQ